MKVLIIGASGLVGSNCLRYFKEKGWEVVGTYFSYATADTVYFDTLNPSNPKNFDVLSFKPDVILHAGALTHVDYCEEHPEESYLKTVQSTINVLEVAKKCNSKLVYVSTDYVFDGQDGPYAENAPLHPLSIYAKHKLMAEEIVQQTNHIIIRITNVYGEEERGKNFISRLISVCQKGEELNLKLPVDQYATPVNAADVAAALYLLLIDNKTGIYHIAGTDFFNRVALANVVLSHFPNHKVRIESVTTAQLNQPALRPLMGGLKADKFMKEYPQFKFTMVEGFVKKF
ncbi:MAG: SDR family oxidoreductase [Bacteroidetes bacterium]|nr:SDR family oxidoreductase [Bacteroidota bacterium]